MQLNILRKILVILIFATPAISYSGCKKQAKCGCGKDVLFTLADEPAYVYFNETGSNIYFTSLSDPYSTYYFCNPSEMFPKMSDYNPGDQLLVSGYVYWDCNYLYQASNSSYGAYYKVYMVEVTNMDLYGKK
jgi:hypothetical protein